MILDVATQTVIEWSNIISKCKKPFWLNQNLFKYFYQIGKFF
jgi:hypothetical protein